MEAHSEIGVIVRTIIEYLALAIELLAVGIIVVSLAFATVRFLAEFRAAEATHRYKVRLGTGLLLGLEVLVAGDVVRTVALEPSLTNVAVLGLLVVIRTFLSWSLTVEVEGRWPWQRRPAGEASSETAG